MPISHSNKILQRKRTIVISGGDPAGIGPEVILKSLANPIISEKTNIVVIGSFKVFKEMAKFLRLRLPPAKNGFTFIDIDNLPPEGIKFGTVDSRYGKASVEYLMYSAALVENTRRAALVTAPINKEAVKKAGFSFDGHTGFLSYVTGSKDVTMMLVGNSLRVALVTRHIALRDVPRFLTTKKIIKTVENTYLALREFFGIKNPRIGIAALNPHAGEGGIFGREEKTIIAPAVKYLRKKIKNLAGPLPSDTLFYKAHRNDLDSVVCMYHDQALIPLKMLAFDRGVNITIGLPFVRTSPDHGTAFDIAGKGIANPSSMIEAIKLAVKIC